jgi:preprotein translocase subunit SecA
MIVDKVLAKVFGTKNEREVKEMQPVVAAISALEPAMRELSDAELAQKTIEFKERIAQGASLDDLLVEAFAVVREAGRRVLNMRHFDVQLMGGMVLHKGKIAEMKTGEGKTLVATLPLLPERALRQRRPRGHGQRLPGQTRLGMDGPALQIPGPAVGVIVHDLSDEERKAAYGADITYGTNNEFGFDYLRDNMKFRITDCVQREYNYAIVDEVDSILIDEARTPLIISGPSEESTDKYYKINRIIPKLIRGEVIEGKEPGEKYTTGDYTIDEKHKTARSPKRASSRWKSCWASAICTTPTTSSTTTTCSRRCAPTCSTSATRNTW